MTMTCVLILSSIAKVYVHVMRRITILIAISICSARRPRAASMELHGLAPRGNPHAIIIRLMCAASTVKPLAQSR